MAEPWTRCVPDRFRCKARWCGTVGVAKSICADVSWRHLLVQSSELRALRLRYLGPRGGSPGEPHAYVRSLPFPPVSPARLLSGNPVDAAGIVYVDAYNDNARPLTHSARCRARNVDNDGAAVIRRTGDCCRTVRLDPDWSRPIRGSSSESALHPANERHRERDFCLREQVTARSISSRFKSEIHVMGVIHYGLECPWFFCTKTIFLREFNRNNRMIYCCIFLELKRLHKFQATLCLQS